MLVTAAGLRLRRELPALFPAGAYRPLATEVTVPAGAIAFARMTEAVDRAQEAVIFVAPRLCARIAGNQRPAPLGGDDWMTSRLFLPPELRDRTFRHAITGAEIRPTHTGDSAWIFLGEAFRTLPVGMLRAV